MSDELVTITVDGQELKAPKGAMLIEVTDRENIHVPRFCYHEKLTVAANCRMCLVEVEKAPKPLPACATPVMDGMVVHTRSSVAREAQKSVMEFLLINHPLDCPICDQGGECELQDVAMGYGRDISEYVEGKRVVFDKNIGPLISTELTRCIHCTRCVRFGTEIAGIREMGMTSRGENARIATYMEDAVSSEMSGNVIDLCPVGALTAKPSRFAARAWEMLQHASIAPHDCVGSNIYAHSLRGEVMRVVPRDNEAINEVWISDRDRFGYEGIDSNDRLTVPMVKEDGEWKEVDWGSALWAAYQAFHLVAEDEALGPDHIAALVSPSSTLEEMYLAQKLIRSLGSNNIDHRLRQSDFSDQTVSPVMPWLGQNIEDLEQLDAALLIASNVRKEQPIIAHRLRKAAINNNAKIHFVNSRRYSMNYTAASNIVVAQQNMVAELSSIAAAAFAASGAAIPSHLQQALSNLSPTVEHKAIASQLKESDKATVLLGSQAFLHSEFASLRALADVIATQTNSMLGYLTESANTAGAWLAGAVPHRGVAGQTSDEIAGKNVSEIIEQSPAAVMLLNVEPDADVALSRALLPKLAQAKVVAISAFDTPVLREYADVLLPAGCFSETSGTFVNVEGFWQSFNGVCAPKGEARPGWKILRVLGNMVAQRDFDYMSSEDVRDECRQQCENIALDNSIASPANVQIKTDGSLKRAGDVPMYAVDGLLRRASALQQTADAETICARMNSEEAARQGVTDCESVIVKQGDASAQLKLVIDDSIPDANVWIPMLVQGNELLGDAFGDISVGKA